MYGNLNLVMFTPLPHQYIDKKPKKDLEPWVGLYNIDPIYLGWTYGSKYLLGGFGLNMPD